MSPSLFLAIASNGSALPPVDTVRLSLVASSAFWFRLVLISGFAVALGCAMEVPETIAIFKRWKAARFEGQILEDDPKHWRIPLAAFGLLIVILGVGAETIFESLDSNAETAVRTHDELVLGNTIVKAGTAKNSADAATADATAAQGSADVAGRKANEAAKTVESVGKRATRIDQELSMAQYFLSEREIRDPAALKNLFASFNGKTIFFRSYIHDGDGYFLCKELGWAASDAGITANDQCGLFQVERPYPNTGIEVFAPDWDSALSLSKGLAPMTLYGASAFATNGGGIIIFVGRKPGAHVGVTAQTRDAEKRAAATRKAQRKAAHPLPK